MNQRLKRKKIQKTIRYDNVIAWIIDEVLREKEIPRL